MPNTEIPPAAQSVAGIIDLQHQIAEAYTPHGTSIGKIISPPPDIQIAWNNIILKKERIYIDENLLVGHQYETMGFIVTGTLPTICPFCGFHDHSVAKAFNGTQVLMTSLEEGDLVEVTPLKGEQLFIVKCKLVYLGRGDGFKILQNVDEICGSILSELAGGDIVQKALKSLTSARGFGDILNGNILNVLGSELGNFVMNSTELNSYLQNLSTAIAPLQDSIQNILSGSGLPNIAGFSKSLPNDLINYAVSNTEIGNIILEGGSKAVSSVQKFVGDTLSNYGISNIDNISGSITDAITKSISANTDLGGALQNGLSAMTSMQGTISDVLSNNGITNIGNIAGVLAGDFTKVLQVNKDLTRFLSFIIYAADYIKKRVGVKKIYGVDFSLSIA